MTLLVFLLLGGVIKEDFLLDQVTAKGFQYDPVIVVTPDGNFAVTWKDALGEEPTSPFNPADMYIRFFDKDGNPLTSAVKLNTDSFPHKSALSVDDSGRVVCVWLEGAIELSDKSIYGKVFDSEGNPVSDRFTVVGGIENMDFTVGCDPRGGFLAAWEWDSFWCKRFDALGNQQGERFSIPAIPYYAVQDLHVGRPQIKINREGTAVLVWEWDRATDQRFICYQIIDTLNNLLVESIEGQFGTVAVDPWYLGTLHSHPQTHWLDDERFAIFWLKDAGVDTSFGIQGKLFNALGDSITPIITLLQDTNALISFSNPSTSLPVSSIHDGRCAAAYVRIFRKPEKYGRYKRVVGFLADTSLTRTTGIFRLPSDDPHYDIQEGLPAVDASVDRIVWVWQDQSEMREIPGDTFTRYYTDVHCKITDWDLVGVEEPPPSSPVTPVTHPVTPVTHFNSVGREIILHYSDCPQGFHAAIYDASGRRVDELQSPNQNGILIWGPHQNPGVYFIVPTSGKAQASKVILIK